MFSPRVPADLAANRLTRAVASARAAGRRLLDLTTTNPTAAGFDYPPDLLRPLANPEARVYRPDARGLRQAREAIAADYARRGDGIRVATEQVVLTSSTSEAYSLLFKLLCAPEGDAVLAPTPSYPLFEHLTRLDGVAMVPYRLEYHGRWMLDEQSVERAWTDRIRAALAVSPNNPTGSFVAAGELEWLDAACAARGAALIVDEVFADYPLRDAAPGAGRRAATALTFRLGGLSKSAGLPQVKLGWIAVDGPAAVAAAAVERLEFICDTYLSVATPVQIAAPELIARGAHVRAQIRARIRHNYGHLRAAAAAQPAVDVLDADAGWTAVLRVPSTRSEEDIVVDLLEHDGVLVHPGFFFDFAHEAFLVISLLPEPQTFAAGVSRILERAGD